MKTLLSVALCAILALTVAVRVSANTTVGTANFSGIVNHVSTENIKVTDTRTGQSLSFMILPKFDQVFSSDGKTTYQMKDIKAGRYVKVYYDQKALGARHADRILILSQSNANLRRE